VTGPLFRLLAITPPTGAVPPNIVARWLAAGAREVGLAVLLREPGRDPRELLAADGRLAAVRRRCRDAGIPLLLNLDPAAVATVDLAAAGLAGLHLRGDPDLAALTRGRDHLRTESEPVLSDRLLGRSCHGRPQPGHALVDYTLFAPVFPPTTAQPGAPVGSKLPAGLAALTAWTREPGAVVFALGGIGPATAAACLAAGAHGLAGIGVFFGEPAQVEQDVAALRDLVAARDRHVEPVSPR
jgi:thiamine monophosphate synthase